MILIFSFGNIARTSLHRRLGYSGLDTLNVSRDGLIKVRSLDLARRWADHRIPPGFHLDHQFLWLQVLYGVSPNENTHYECYALSRAPIVRSLPTHHFISFTTKHVLQYFFSFGENTRFRRRIVGRCL